MNSIIRAISLALTLFIAVIANAQLSNEEMERLKSKVYTDLAMDEINDGARVYRTSKHWTLVSFATISSNFKPSQQNRQVQIVVTRNAIEFLKGTMNKSTSVYDAYSSEEHSLSEQQGRKVDQEGQTIDSETSSNTRETSQSVEKETMSDKIVQESIQKIDGLQPLLKYKGEEGTIYAYYMVISKHSAKKKR